MNSAETVRRYQISKHLLSVTSGSLVPESDLCVCMLCLEQESIKDSVMNLITYPWIRDRVKSGEVKIHGCYYNLSDCSLEKWRLSSDKNSNEFYVSDKEIWN